MKTKILIIFLSALLLQSRLSACSCIGNASVKKAIKESNFVLVGKVVGQKPFSVYDTFFNAKVELMIYQIEVITLYKGKTKVLQLDVYSGTGDDDCGYNFSVGSEYIIYADYKIQYYGKGPKVNKFLYTTICTRTKLRDENELNEIQKWKKPCTSPSTEIPR